MIGTLMSDQILIRGLTFWGHHGVRDAEQAIGGRYRVDADLDVRLDAAAASDTLADTVSYSQVARTLHAVGVENRFRLLEALAGAMAQAVLDKFPVDAVTVRVMKAPPPVAEVPLEEAGVAITRRRPRSGGQET
jgi:dihydroneopterin aldolase